VKGRREHLLPYSVLALAFRATADDPRWRETDRRHGTNADGENGPAARSFAADAHDCIMVRI